jgi:hypothetical protein
MTSLTALILQCFTYISYAESPLTAHETINAETRATKQNALPHNNNYSDEAVYNYNRDLSFLRIPIPFESE